MVGNGNGDGEDDGVGWLVSDAHGEGFGWYGMVMVRMMVMVVVGWLMVVMLRMVRIVPALQAIDQEKRVCRRERSLTLTKTNLLENRRQVKIS